ncbi:unnamed protein product [Thlaspi arvense]|uniref:Uncharacterized protein n=1 Tax=Thlaspi arvense TaxID=13288 RepID=A0AAU9RH36_THLAR|nr:unnamed protein product [Thlaspi arvense]
MMKMYEITMRKMQSEIETKENDIAALEKELEEIISNNKTLEKRLNSSGQFSVLDCVDPSNATPNGFNIALHYAVRSIRSFVKVMIREMESANWDIEAAASAIEPEIVFPKSNHRCFAFESFVCRECSMGSTLTPIRYPTSPSHLEINAEENDKVRRVARHGFLRGVHGSGQARLALALLAFSFDQEVQIFQVKRNCRSSEVYMEKRGGGRVHRRGGQRIPSGFHVVPGLRSGRR